VTSTAKNVLRTLRGVRRRIDTLEEKLEAARVERNRAMADAKREVPALAVTEIAEAAGVSHTYARRSVLHSGVPPAGPGRRAS
jgi:hypothetical protein